MSLSAPSSSAQGADTSIEFQRNPQPQQQAHDDQHIDVDHVIQLCLSFLPLLQENPARSLVTVCAVSNRWRKLALQAGGPPAQALMIIPILRQLARTSRHHQQAAATALDTVQIISNEAAAATGELEGEQSLRPGFLASVEKWLSAPRKPDAAASASEEAREAIRRLAQSVKFHWGYLRAGDNQEEAQVRFTVGDGVAPCVFESVFESHFDSNQGTLFSSDLRLDILDDLAYKERFVCTKVCWPAGQPVKWNFEPFRTLFEQAVSSSRSSPQQKQLATDVAALSDTDLKGVLALATNCCPIPPSPGGPSYQGDKTYLLDKGHMALSYVMELVEADDMAYGTERKYARKKER
eukprot:gene12593-3691_t